MRLQAADALARLDDVRLRLGGGARPVRSVAVRLTVAAFVLANLCQVSKFWTIPSWNKKIKKTLDTMYIIVYICIYKTKR